MICPECVHDLERDHETEAHEYKSLCVKCDCVIAGNVLAIRSRSDKFTRKSAIRRRRRAPEPEAVVMEGAGVSRRKKSDDLADHALPGGLPGTKR